MPQGSIPPREVFSNIEIQSDGTWFHSSTPIINNDILLFFKRNLHVDSKGLYIYNTISDLSEKVYIKVNGPIMSCVGFKDNMFILETGETLLEKKSNLLIYRNKMENFNEMESLYLSVEKLNGRAKLRRQAILDISTELNFVNGGIKWKDQCIPEVTEIQWVINKER